MFVKIDIKVFLRAQPVLKLSGIKVLHRALLRFNDLLLLHSSNVWKVVLISWKDSIVIIRVV